MSSTQSFSIVEFHGEHSQSHCGYCKKNGSVSNGMWAHQMTVQDYQDLIDRGWRRSGQYCYKPSMEETCCPSYTIKCDVRNFKLSKSHKKVLKRMNKFLQDGIRDKNEQNLDFLAESNESICKSTEEINLTKSNKKNESESTENEINKEVLNDILPETSKSNICPPRKKAKLLRLERKKEKLAKQGIEFVNTPKENAKEKTFLEYFKEEPKNGRHKLQVKTVPSRDCNTDEIYKLFKDYQIHVHDDPESKLSIKKYSRFLVKSPLKIKLIHVKSNEFSNTLNTSFCLYQKYQTTIHNDPPESVESYLMFLQKSPLKLETGENKPEFGLGSFHQQYWLDDKLIAVAVIDILPKCVSSVYFFYDPHYGFLSLGTYSSLREIYFTHQLQETHAELHNYYMGFYIHSCPKMRYKAYIRPSFLLCPETYTWHIITDELIKKLDEKEYQRLSLNLNERDLNEFDESNLGMNVVYYKKYMSYAMYVSLKGQDELENIIEYGKLVGKKLLDSMILVLN